MSCTFFLGISSFNAELQSYVGFFEKTSIGPRYGGVLEGFSKKNMYPPFFETLFNVDLDFAIKHDLLLWYDYVMGI